LISQQQVTKNYSGAQGSKSSWCHASNVDATPVLARCSLETQAGLLTVTIWSHFRFVLPVQALEVICRIAVCGQSGGNESYQSERPSQFVRVRYTPTKMKSAPPIFRTQYSICVTR